jgi:beta-phosphoglucomutase family hydrolase
MRDYRSAKVLKAEAEFLEENMRDLISVVIFDMDGVIIDSEPMQLSAYNKVLEDYGVRLSEEDFIRWCVGHKGYDIVTFLRNYFNLSESVENLLSAKNTAYLSLLRQNIHLMPGLLPLLDHLIKFGYRLAVASSSSVSDIEEVLAGLGIREKFQTVVSAEEVSKGKPAPDIFLETARRLDVTPDKCAVLEDSQSGVEAAALAGMYCIAVPNRFTAFQDFSRANVRVPDLFAVSRLL